MDGSQRCRAAQDLYADLMRLALAWGEQAGREGAEPAKARRDGNRCIKEREASEARGSARKALALIVRDGTRLLKERGGATLEVLVTEEGAIWNGQSYTSLSAVARVMTKTNRNGPKFFGL
ncbi:MAG: DUF2924 domain-containing protein [Pseudomonadota bacterium]